MCNCSKYSVIIVLFAPRGLSSYDEADCAAHGRPITWQKRLLVLTRCIHSVNWRHVIETKGQMNRDMLISL